MKWTEEQKKTIETRDKNILVSAAAGSGKTAVLIQRIKSLMLDDKVDIDRFLITTFTNAASAELKERLEKAVREELEKPDADQTFLKRQLTLMPRASISTFHTFALEIMRRFFYVTDLEPGFRIGDDIEVSILKKEAVDEVFRRRFEEDYESFQDFLTKYSSDRNENRIKANLIALYDEMRSIPRYMEWAEDRTALLKESAPSEALGLTNFIAQECKSGLWEAARHYERAALLLEEAGIDSLSEKAGQDAEKVLQAAEDLAEEDCDVLQRFQALFGTFHFNQMRAAKAEQEAYDAVKEQVSEHRKNGKKRLEELNKKYFQRTIEEYDAELGESYEDTVYLLGLIRDFEAVFREKKQEKSMVDFDDVMHYALAILEDDMAASEYRDRFRYIFIDEYQDSNLLQEAIASKIARENNLFMVGDVKQSIYRFRLAEPDIFRNRYAEYHRREDENSINIDLNSNFRSKRNVTEVVNHVFRDIMEGYDDSAQLHCTIGEEYPGCRPQLHIIETGKLQDELPDSIQMEAQQVMQIIGENLGRMIYDVKAEAMRPLEYRDIAVLSRSRAMIGGLERALNNAGIPAYGENTGGYFESVEIQVFVDLLRTVDNSRQDIPLISVMRSAVFDFDVRELADIRIFSQDGEYHEAVRRYADDGPDETLREKTKEMLQRLNHWKQMKTAVSLEELVRVLLYDTGYYDYCSGLPAGKQRISNLQLLAEKAGSFEQNNHSGLYGFLSYIEAMRNNRLAVGEAKMLGEKENVVRVMTVHKSKGLEFPLVILTGAGRAIKAGGAGNAAVMHKDFAIGLPHVDIGQRWHRKTLLQRVVDGKKAAEAMEEEIRILYVALTRAMDAIAVTATVRDTSKLAYGTGLRRSFLDMLYHPMAESGAELVIHDPEAEDPDEADDVFRRRNPAELFARSICEKDAEQQKAIDRRLSFEYPYVGSSTIRTKYSVTELNKRSAQETLSSEKRINANGSAVGTLAAPVFSMEQKTLSAADIGTAMHLVMEKTDFRKALEDGTPYIEEVVGKLLEDGALEKEEAAAIVPEDIAAFFTLDVGQRAARAETLEKEREFILQKDLDGGQTIVQGIIDCYFEDEDGLVLIDYKNSHIGADVSQEVILERYREQMALYREAIEAAVEKKVKEEYLYLFKARKFLTID